MKRRITLVTLSTIVCIFSIFFLLFIHCSRDNPFDVNSQNHKPGSKPHVYFVDSLITGYLYDTVHIRVTWSDTALGGIKGAIKRFFIDWEGNGTFSDSVNGSSLDTLTFAKTFAPKDNAIRIKAVDFENDTSLIDSAWLRIKTSTPEISLLNSPATVSKGIPFTINLKATDTGGVITEFFWTDNKSLSKTTLTGSLTHTFEQIGSKTILVKARDNKKIESNQLLIPIEITDPNDTSGPQIAFLSPIDADTVHTKDCIISLQVTDASGVSGVTLNDIAMQLVGLTWRGTVRLNKGDNILTVTAIDTKQYTSTASIHVFYSPSDVDRTPPMVTLIAPAHWTDTVYTDSTVIKLLARDESGVAEVFIDKQAMIFDNTDSSYQAVRHLEEGLNRFTIRSIDQMGNASNDSLSVIYIKGAKDSVKPVITIIEPRYLQHIADSVVLIRGTATDASTISALKVNGKDAVMQYPSWSAVCALKHGYDTITITAVDASINKNTSEKSIIVIQNYPPEFTQTPKDNFLVVNTSTTFSAAATDDDDSIAFSIKRSPALGTVSSLSTNHPHVSFTYSANKTGVDTLVLVAVDRWGDVDSVKWRIFVRSPLDSTPVFTTDSKTLPYSVMALDTLHTSVHAQDPNEKPLTYSFVKPAPEGISIDSLTGAITWVPPVADTGKKEIIILASNGNQKSTLTWNITVLPENQPPKLVSPGNKTVNENQILQFVLEATDPNNDSLEFLFGSTFPNGAKLDHNQFSWTPSFSSAGTHKVVFVIKEKNRKQPLSDSQTIFITVINSNQKPVLTNPGTINGVVNQKMTYTLTATDPDGDKITFAMIDEPNGSVLDENTYTWTPTYSDAGEHSVKFIASDKFLSDTITVTLKIKNVNGTPVLTKPANQTISENQLLEFTLEASDPNNDSLIFSMKNDAPSGATLKGSAFSWRPDYTQAGSYTITFYVRDNVSPPLTDSAKITIKVNNVNAPPVLTNPGNKIVNENTRLVFALSATDVDNDALTFTMANPPPGATLVGNTFAWTPSFEQAGVYQMTFFVKDNTVSPLRDSQAIIITVSNVNRPPIIADSLPKNINENETLEFQVNAYDPDPNTPVYFISPNLPEGAKLDNRAWGKFSWKPTFSQAGTYSVKFIALDSSNALAVLSDTANITIVVKNVNRPPVFTDPAAQTIAEKQTLSVQLRASDPDMDQLSFNSVTNLPGGATLSPAGLFTWTPGITDAKDHYIRFIVRDNSIPVLSDTTTLKITVTNTNPSLPGLVSPIDKASAQQKSVTFEWSKATDASGYFIQVARNVTFANIFTQDSTLTDTIKPVAGLDNGATYFWRVRALNNGGRSEWTAPRSFATIPVYQLTIRAKDSGSVTASPSPGPYDSATVVKLKAAAKPGYHFTNWSDSASGSKDTISVIMNKVKTVTANFVINSYNLTVNAGTGGKITVPGGAFPQSVNHGVATTITAAPNTGYDFVKWTVDSGTAVIADSTKLATKVTLFSGDARIKAVFAINNFTVTFVEGTGGSIKGTLIQRVAYGGSCSQVKAEASTGYTFDGWSGGRTSATDTFTVTNVTSDMTITANFVQKSYKVTFHSSEGGSLSGYTVQNIFHGENCTKITAVPDEGYSFAGWDGYSGSENPLTLKNITSDTTITAKFARMSYKVIFQSNTEHGNIEGEVEQIVLHGGSCSQVTPDPQKGYTFIGWEGDYTGTDNPLTITNVTSDMIITAHFEPWHTVVFSAGSGGLINGDITYTQTVTHYNPCETVTAQPEPGYEFVEWEGVDGILKTANPLSIESVTSDMTITAIFRGIIPPVENIR